jgi:hypothetical protein
MRKWRQIYNVVNPVLVSCGFMLMSCIGSGVAHDLSMANSFFPPLLLPFRLTLRGGRNFDEPSAGLQDEDLTAQEKQDAGVNVSTHVLMPGDEITSGYQGQPAGEDGELQEQEGGEPSPLQASGTAGGNITITNDKGRLPKEQIEEMIKKAEEVAIRASVGVCVLGSDGAATSFQQATTGQAVAFENEERPEKAQEAEQEVDWREDRARGEGWIPDERDRAATVPFREIEPGVCTIRISNLPDDCKPREVYCLVRFLQGFRFLTLFRPPRHRSMSAFVTFRTPGDAAGMKNQEIERL